MGPIVLSMNPYREVGNPLTLASTKSCHKSPELTKVVQEVIRLQGETGYPQAIIVSGASGSGKSTCIQLIQRFYDPNFGVVTLDGRNLRELNVGWARDLIGVVSQEPVLFSCSIKENIRYGNLGVTDAEIDQACRDANAAEFISQLPKVINLFIMLMT